MNLRINVGVRSVKGIQSPKELNKWDVLEAQLLDCSLQWKKIDSINPTTKIALVISSATAWDSMLNPRNAPSFQKLLNNCKHQSLTLLAVGPETQKKIAKEGPILFPGESSFFQNITSPGSETGLMATLKNLDFSYNLVLFGAQNGKATSAEALKVCGDHPTCLVFELYELAPRPKALDEFWTIVSARAQRSFGLTDRTVTNTQTVSLELEFKSGATAKAFLDIWPSLMDSPNANQTVDLRLIATGQSTQAVFMSHFGNSGPVHVNLDQS